MDTINALRAYMQFYRDNLQGPRQSYNTWDGAARMANDDGAAALWARDMLDRAPARAERPDFFGSDEPPANAMATYMAPARFDEPMPTRARPADRLRPQITNYIARVLGGR